MIFFKCRKALLLKYTYDMTELDNYKFLASRKTSREKILNGWDYCYSTTI